MIGAKCVELSALPMANEVCCELIEGLDAGAVVLGGGASIRFEGHQTIYFTWRNTDEFPLLVADSIDHEWTVGSLAVIPLLSRAGGWSDYANAELQSTDLYQESGELFGVQLNMTANGKQLPLRVGTGWSVACSKWSDDLLLESHEASHFEFMFAQPTQSSEASQ